MPPPSTIGMSMPSRRCDTSCLSVSVGRISMPGTKDASFALTFGTNAVS